MVHFRNDSVHDLPLRTLRNDLRPGWTVEYDHEEDLYRTYGRPGQTDGADLHAFLTDWCGAREINPKGLRVETGYRRRQIKDLPETFLADLCQHYHVIGMRRVQRHMSSIALHYNDSADISQAVYMQILQAVSRYDQDKGIAFGAFLSAKLSHWAHGLARAQFGRTACEAELKQQRAIAAFQHEHNRTPSEPELAQALNISLSAVREAKHTSGVMNALRNMQTLNGGPEEREIPLADDSFVEEQLLHDEEQSLLSQALTAACAADLGDADGQEPNVLGWAAWYFTTWGGMNKQSLASTLKTSPRNMNAHADRARAKMAERLSV
jgi:DNA-directed RNA polymerase specialized sigma subunit